MKRIYNDEKLSYGDSFSWRPNNAPEEFVSFYQNQGVTMAFVHDGRENEKAMDGFGTHPVDLPWAIHNLTNGSSGLTDSSTTQVILNDEAYAGPEIGFTSMHCSFTFSVYYNRTAKAAFHV